MSSQLQVAIELYESGVTKPDTKEFQKLTDLICEKTLKAIKDMEFTEMTEVQYQSIIPLLAGNDILCSAKTGSGKTLAFLIPAIEMLYKRQFKAKDGTGVIIIVPTRELAIQITGVARDLLKHHSFSFGIVMGGADRNIEQKKLEKGCNLLISTPGRLMDHLESTNFVTKNLFQLIIDEADRIMEIGFEEELMKIVQKLPLKRQTILFSATQTEHVRNLAKISLNNKPLYIGVDSHQNIPTVETLKQGFIIVPPALRFVLLYSFIKRNISKKIMVFFSTCNSVQFFSEFFNYVDINVFEIHGKLKQSKRTSTFLQFINANAGVLFCTDVAARGLDIPAVDWIVQFDPPDDPNEYIHRVGRTARGVQSSGQAVLVLLAEEIGFIHFLKKRNIPITEFDFKKAKLCEIQNDFMKLIDTNYQLNTSAKLAFQSYIHSYAAHSNKDIFNVHSLDISQICKSFGFQTPPHVNIDFNAKRVRSIPKKEKYKRGGVYKTKLKKAKL